MGAEIFGELLLLFILGINFSMVSIRRWRRSRWGLKKNSWRGVEGGGRSASPPNAFAEHAT